VTTGQFQRNRENFCYRHPDRQSFVLCQRCLRTICPECQTQGAVGVICPECLRDQQKAQSPAQVKAQRRAAMPRAVTVRDTRPLATYVIIGVTVGRESARVTARGRDHRRSAFCCAGDWAFC